MTYDEIRALSGLVGMLFFIFTFIGVTLWVFRPKSKERFEKDAQIPFKEDN
tara:strand:- start:281422 stop:281574 length:153 start_codon:yes stop_codon:yes gene_type:complete